MMSLPLFRECGWCGWGNALLKNQKLLSPLEQASLSGQNLSMVCHPNVPSDVFYLSDSVAVAYCHLPEDVLV